MTKPLIQIDDEVREMNDDEFENYQTIVAEIDARKAEAEAKAEAKLAAQAKLSALGLTVEDLQALGL
jgi:multidrug efflux pump subunit AcrA (membrane-fusion protein)